MKKIKQQKQIKQYLISEFGEETGNRLFDLEEHKLYEVIASTKNKSENQMKTLEQTILPRIALYKVLLEESSTKDKAYEYIRKYMIDVVAKQKHSSTAKMEMVPGFYTIYSNIFLKIMRTTDLQVSTQEKGKDYYNVTITKCLWHTACVENHCEELCRVFCDVDNVTYGGLNKIGFTRTKTLGYGGDSCDFHFFKK